MSLFDSQNNDTLNNEKRTPPFLDFVTRFHRSPYHDLPHNTMKSTAASRAARLKELEAKQRVRINSNASRHDQRLTGQQKASGKLSLEDLAPELRT